MNVLGIENLVRVYRGFTLGPVSFDLQAGTATALVGANGAGKSTLFRCLMGLLRMQQGNVTINGERALDDSASWRCHIGYVGDHISLFDSWSGLHNLQAFSHFYPDWDSRLAADMAQRLGLDLTVKPKHYSTGQRTKLGIIVALAHRPPLLLLDEPATGLDPVSREVFSDLLFELAEPGDMAILYATHHIGEIENLADRLLFLNQGMLVEDAIKEDLTENWRKLTFRSPAAFPEIPAATTQRSDSSYQELISRDARASIDWLKAQGIEEIQSSRLPLEKISVQILKQTLHDSGDPVRAGGDQHV